MKERYEQEIEQLLIELESRPPDDTNAPPGSAPLSSTPAERAAAGEGVATPPDDQPSPYAPRPRPGVRLIAPPKLALAGLIIAALGLFPFVPWQVALAGLAIVGVAVAWLFLRRMGGTRTPAASGYWRGRALGAEPQGAWQRFRQWLAQ